MFSIICSACGKEAMVPFLPEEKENPMCTDCFKLHQRMLAEETAEDATETMQSLGLLSIAHSYGFRIVAALRNAKISRNVEAHDFDRKLRRGGIFGGGGTGGGGGAPGRYY